MMKALKPSHKENKRYLLIRGRDADQESIDRAILDYIGILGYAEACPKIIKKDRNKLIVAINRGSLDKVRASFVLDNKEIIIEKVSGSAGKLK